MRKQTLFGIILGIIGLNILFNSINLSVGSFVAPLIFFVLAMFFYKRKHTFLSLLFFIISASILFDMVLNLNFFSILISAVVIYFGVRLLKSNKYKEEMAEERKRSRNDQLDQEEHQDYSTSFDNDTPIVRKSLIGEVNYSKSFELKDMTIWNGIGEVRIDLSRAIISEGETVIIAQGLIGEIHFFIPDDLAVSIQASTMVGEVALLHEKHGGINQQLSITTKGYKEAPRRVKLVLSMAIGEVKVRAL